MKKEQIKAVIHIITIILFLATLITTLVLLLFFEPIKGMSYTTLLDLSKKEWYDLHLWLFISFAVLAIINFVLGWKNFKKQAKSLFLKRE